MHLTTMLDFLTEPLLIIFSFNIFGDIEQLLNSYFFVQDEIFCKYVGYMHYKITNTPAPNSQTTWYPHLAPRL